MAWEKEDFKPKGIYSLVYERSRTSFVDSDAYREGAKVGGQVRGQGLVLPHWWTFCSPWAFVLGHKHCFFFFFFFHVEATYLFSWRCISYRLFTFVLFLQHPVCSWHQQSALFFLLGWWMTKQLLGAVNCITELLPPRTLFWANVECVFLRQQITPSP